MKIIVAGIDTFCELDEGSNGSQLTFQGCFRQISFIATEDAESIQITSGHIVQIIEVVSFAVLYEVIDTPPIGLDGTLSKVVLFFGEKHLESFRGR